MSCQWQSQALSIFLSQTVLSVVWKISSPLSLLTQHLLGPLEALYMLLYGPKLPLLWTASASLGQRPGLLHGHGGRMLPLLMADSCSNRRSYAQHSMHK